jgi:tRNA threonylcarbamoyl adenosine modification protein YeaZ
MDRGHQERIAPLVQEVFAEAGISLQRLRRIGVTTGPGSFTGLRVGLAFARTLAMTLGCDCVGLSSLDALAATAPSSGTTLSAIPSRQDLMFVAFHVDGAPVMAPDQLGVPEIAARLAEIGIVMLDTPVSGGQVAARGGSMTVMASGSAAAFDRVAPVLDAIAGKVWRLGDEVGVGSTVKMVNQLLAGVHIAVAAEAMALGIRAGADPQTLFDVISSSAGSSKAKVGVVAPVPTEATQRSRHSCACSDSSRDCKASLWTEIARSRNATRRSS